MARRKLSMNEYLEMVYQWHQGRSVRQIRDSLKMSRKTIHKYLRLLEEEGLSRERPLPEEAELAQRVASVVKSAVFEQPARERIRPYHPQIVDWLNQPDMTIQQVQRLLQENHELGVSYMSVHRYVRSHIQPLERPVTVRLHPPAGEQAQVDFGYAGLMRDPQSGNLRRAWAFILILSHSRHRFVRFVFRQDNRSWLDCHIRALQFFGGCPALIVLDNLKNGVLRPDLYDPTLNPAYAELERHYGFVADPAKVAMARHKGKVERCVPVVRQQLLAGREFRDIDEANRRALEWCLQEVGLREHGTTHRKPYEVFLAEEAPQLLPLPEQPFEAPEWKECTVHWDCHLILDKCYYSIPYPYRGEKLWVRADLKLVRVYREHQLIKTHVRVFEPGTWQTDEADYPPDKRAYLEQTPAYCHTQAEQLGAEVARYMRRILADHAMRNVRKAQAVLRLGQRYGATALDQACGRALSFDNLRLASLKEILEKGLWRQPATPIRPSSPAPAACRFARPQDYFVNSVAQEVL